jgi:excisionase family DNA binding protein
MSTSIDRLLTKAEASTFLQVSKPTLDRLVKSGVIKAIKIGRSVRFTRETLQEPNYSASKNQS